MKCLALHLLADRPPKPLLWSPSSSGHLLCQQWPFLIWPPLLPQCFLSLKGSQVSLFLKTWITTTALGWAEVPLCSGHSNFFMCLRLLSGFLLCPHSSVDHRWTSASATPINLPLLRSLAISGWVDSWLKLSFSYQVFPILLLSLWLFPFWFFWSSHFSFRCPSNIGVI